MGVLERLRMLSPDQRDALRAVEAEERKVEEIEALEEEHLTVQEVYLRRRDRLLGREVADVYSDIESARAVLRREFGEQRKRFERMRMSILSGGAGGGASPEQLELLPGHG
jgi:hypothetical protein